MPARKRAIEEVEAPSAPMPVDSPLLKELRGMWEFACLMQYIYSFGECIKISAEVDIEMLEMECCKPTPSDLLPQIGLALLKHVSSHRGLTPEIFDEYTRRQYNAKFPATPDRNPFGQDEEPRKFADFDVPTKIRVLHQLSVWTLNNPNRIREYYAQSVPDQTQWRVEEFGWDKQERSYFVLDDSRMYRLTKPKPEPIPKLKLKSKPKAKPMPQKTKGSRSSKRQKLVNGEEADPQEEETPVVEDVEDEENKDNGLGGATWECIAVSTEDYVEFVESIRKSKDPDEKALVKRMQEEIMPEIERQAAARERKEAAQRKEFTNMEKLATAKRSSRLADKQDKAKEQQEREDAERKQREDLAMARREQEKQRKLEDARESRMMTREQRLKEREIKRILHEDELKRLEEQEQDIDSVEGRVSERKRKTEVEKKKQELQKWTESDGEWWFDCAICGVHGKNLDDGSHSIACDKCDTWQHSDCHGIRIEEAEKEDFHFLCASCSQPRQIKVKTPSSTSPDDNKNERKAPTDYDHNGRSPSKQHIASSTAGVPTAPPVVMIRTQQRPPQQHWNTSHSSQTMNGYYQPQINGKPQQHSSSHSAPRPYLPPTYQQNLPHASTQSFQTNGYGVQRPTSSHQTAGGMQYHQSLPISGPLPVPTSQGHQGQALYNPYQNALQYPSSSHRPSSSTSSTPRPSSSQHQINGQQRSFASPQLQQAMYQQVTPQPNTHSPHMSASPTPSLAPTQGQTNIRFSSANYDHTALASAYMPSNNHPTTAAHSPMKQASPPSSNPQPLLNDSSQHAAITGSHAPTLHSSSPNGRDRTAGISPIKHDMLPSSPLQAPLEPLNSVQSSIPFGLDGIIESPTKAKHGAVSPMPPVSSMPSLASPPSLQPNVGGQNGLGIALQPPVKRDMSSPNGTS